MEKERKKRSQDVKEVRGTGRKIGRQGGKCGVVIFRNNNKSEKKIR